LPERSTEAAVLVVEQPKPAPADPAALLEAIRIAVSSATAIDLDQIVLTQRRALPQDIERKDQRSRTRAHAARRVRCRCSPSGASDDISDSTSIRADAIAAVLELTRQTESDQLRSIKTYLGRHLRRTPRFSAEDLDGATRSSRWASRPLDSTRDQDENRSGFHDPPRSWRVWQDIDFPSCGELHRSVRDPRCGRTPPRSTRLAAEMRSV